MLIRYKDNNINLNLVTNLSLNKISETCVFINFLHAGQHASAYPNATAWGFNSYDEAVNIYNFILNKYFIDLATLSDQKGM